jgi:uncharacterized membrane protein
VKENMMKINIKKFNVFTLISLLLLIFGVGLYIYWGVRFGVWYDIGIYSVTSVFVISGIVGILLSLYEKTEEQP